MLREKKPNFFSLNIMNVFITIVSFIALFSFWNKLEDKEKLLYIIIPAILLLLLANLIRYCIEVNKFYRTYSKLFDNNQGLIQNYKDNKSALEQEKYNNEVLREFANNTMAVLITYNDMTEEEKTKLRKEIIARFINGNSNGGEENERKVQSNKDN